MSGPASLPPSVRQVADLLADGRDDRAVAREVGVTVRTVRRRVAELMRALQARTRFQAGYLIGRGEAPPGTGPLEDRREEFRGPTQNTT
jgi:DNA-binding NarL/FixJ family response regulator